MTDKKTKKQIEEELENVTAERDNLVNAYNELMTQAQAVQKVSNDRLMSMRLLESFTNTVLAAGEQLRRDMTELNLVQRQSQEEQAQTDGDGN
jgi:flagellar hook-basal body complex protein FliE